MKHNWEYKRLQDISEILYGYPFESGKFNSEKKGMPLIRIRDVKPGKTETFFDGEYSPDYIIKEGNYLIGMDGEFNIAPWKSVDALLNQRVCRVESNSEEHCLTAFLYYYLGVELKRIEEKTSFVTVKHLSAKVLNNISIPLPPIKVQHQIVAELDKLNEMIATRKEQLKELDNLAQSLFYDTFGDPITNPKGWEMVSLKSVCSNIVDCPHSTPKKSSVPTEYPCIRTSELTDSGIDWTTMQYLDEKEYVKRVQRLKPQYGDLIYGREGTVGGCVMVPKEKHFSLGQRTMMFRPSTINPVFLLATFRSPWIRNQTEQKMIGQTVKHVNIKDIIEFIVPNPPIELQILFSTQVEAIEKQKEIVEASIAELQTLLDSRMDYWFN